MSLEGGSYCGPVVQWFCEWCIRGFLCFGMTKKGGFPHGCRLNVFSKLNGGSRGWCFCGVVGLQSGEVGTHEIK